LKLKSLKKDISKKSDTNYNTINEEDGKNTPLSNSNNAITIGELDQSSKVYDEQIPKYH